MLVNRASASSLRSASVRVDAAAGSMADAPMNGVAPIAAAENGVSDDAPPPPPPVLLREEDDRSERLIDAIDPALAYRAASSMLRRQGMVGLLLNRTA